MRLRCAFLFAAAVLVTASRRSAQVQPHRAEYTLRLGAAANAPRIGTAVHDLTQDCAGWHLKRDIKTEIALTASWKMSLASKLDSEETRNAFRYGTVQIQNGSQRDVKGRVQRQGGELRAEIVYGRQPAQPVRPAAAHPDAGRRHRSPDRAAGRQGRVLPRPDVRPEVIGDVFLIEVTEQDRATVRGARPADQPVTLPAGKSWPVFMNFTRGRTGPEAAVQRSRALVFDNGVLDRLTVETGLLTRHRRPRRPWKCARRRSVRGPRRERSRR